jgi:hypothetical protein
LSNQESVYHYTTALGLKGILESKSLFATHHNFLNDTNEIEKGLEIFSKSKKLFRFQVIENYKKEFMLKRNDNVDYPLSKFEFIGELFDQWWANFENFCNSVNVFITSFTFVGDSLNHWSHYGDKQTSYCIKFNKEKFSSTYNMPLKSIVSKGAVRYDDSITDIVNSFTEFFSQGVMKGYDQRKLKNTESFDTDLEIGTLFAECLNEILFEAATIKGRAFFQEEEFRSILIFPDELKINGQKSKNFFELTDYDEFEDEMRKESKLKFRCSEQGVFVPYHSVPFDISSIEEIIIGKSNHKQESILGLEMLLDSLDLNIKVSSTKNSFRSF